MMAVRDASHKSSKEQCEPTDGRDSTPVAIPLPETLAQVCSSEGATSQTCHTPTSWSSGEPKGRYSFPEDHGLGLMLRRNVSISII